VRVCARIVARCINNACHVAVCASDTRDIVRRDADPCNVGFDGGAPRHARSSQWGMLRAISPYAPVNISLPAAEMPDERQVTVSNDAVHADVLTAGPTMHITYRLSPRMIIYRNTWSASPGSREPTRLATDRLAFSRHFDTPRRII